jgi:anti-anti-sigma factor
MLELEVKSLKKVEVIAITGRIDSSTAADFDNVLRSALNKGRYNLVLDMAKLDYISSAGLRAMVAALKTARNSGGNVVIAQANERVVDTLKLVGFQSLFTQFGNVLDAVDSF